MYKPARRFAAEGITITNGFQNLDIPRLSSRLSWSRRNYLRSPRISSAAGFCKPVLAARRAFPEARVVPVAAIAAIRRTGFTEYPASEAASLRLDVGRSDHFAPLLRIVADELSKVRGRTHKRCATQVSKPRFRLGVGEYLIDLPVELVDDLGGRALWRAHAVPRADLVARDKLAYGRKVRHCLRAHRAGYRKSAQLAGSDVFNR